MAGSLFGSGVGFLLVCTLSSIGVSACYLLSKICGVEKLIVNYLPHQLTSSKISLENLVSRIHLILIIINQYLISFYLNLMSF